jgi:hypothetical protein
LTNFSSGKQTQESLKSDFLKSEFQKQTWLNMYLLSSFCRKIIIGNWVTEVQSCQPCTWITASVHLVFFYMVSANLFSFPFFA